MQTAAPKIIREGMENLLPLRHRSPGVHSTEIIRYIVSKTSRHSNVDTPYDRDCDDPATRNRMELGLTFEHAVMDRYCRHHPGRYIQPGEAERDGITVTGDILDTVDWVPEEVKLTWLSSANGPGSEPFWRYEVQLMAQCWVWEARVGRLHVGFVNGNYKWGRGGSGPVYRVWEYRFTRQDLGENWWMLVTNAREMVRERRGRS